MKQNASYWEGWQAQHAAPPQLCKYEPGPERDDWARGFAQAVWDERKAKVWWRSKTFHVGLTLAFVGAGLAFLGHGNGAKIPLSCAGEGLTLNALLMMFLRTITNQPVEFR